MRALITGGGGQLASDLQELLGGRARSYSHAELDITDPAALDRAYTLVKPDVVFNCAAFHNVDLCETELERAWSVNARAVHDLARRGPRLVHLSTNYVFDGRRDEPYGESDVPAPQSIYAATKLAGEYLALAYGREALVVRTAGLYGLRGSTVKGGNFVQRMIEHARNGGELRMVADQRLQPTFTADLAEAIIDAVEQSVRGVIHLTAEGACSWYEFTREIMSLAGMHVVIEPVSTTVPKGGADRPLNGVLTSIRRDLLGLTPIRSWQQGLADYMMRGALTMN